MIWLPVQDKQLELVLTLFLQHDFKKYKNPTDYCIFGMFSFMTFFQFYEILRHWLMYSSAKTVPEQGLHCGLDFDYLSKTFISLYFNHSVLWTTVQLWSISAKMQCLALAKHGGGLWGQTAWPWSHLSIGQFVLWYVQMQFWKPLSCFHCFSRQKKLSHSNPSKQTVATSFFFV